MNFQPAIVSHLNSWIESTREVTPQFFLEQRPTDLAHFQNRLAGLITRAMGLEGVLDLVDNQHSEIVNRFICLDILLKQEFKQLLSLKA